MGWLSDIGDAVGNAVSDVAGAVGDVVEGVTDAVVHTVQSGVDTGIGWLQGLLGTGSTWLCEHAGGFGCAFGNIVFGAVSGVLEGVKDIVDAAADVIIHGVRAVVRLLHGDLGGFVSELVSTIAAAVELVLDVVRFVLLGTVVNGVVTAWQAEELRAFVSDLLNTTFADDPDRLARIRDRVSIDDARWGLPLDAKLSVEVLDSATVPLRDWHAAGELNLYSMAGLPGEFSIQRPRTEVRAASKDGTEGSFPIMRSTLSSYIDDGEGRIRVYALTDEAQQDIIQVAKDKWRACGIDLSFDTGDRFDFSQRMNVVEIATLEELHFNRDKTATFLADHGLTDRDDPLSQRRVAAVAAFEFLTGLGQTSGRKIEEGTASTPCATTGRTDQCCSTLQRKIAAGVMFHDQWPPQIFRYALAHEIGHYLGLCHFGHDGFQSIMYTPAKDAGLSAASWGLFRYYLDNEPSFTLDDAKNVWRFLVTQLAFALESPVPVTGVVARVVATG